MKMRFTLLAAAAAMLFTAQAETLTFQMGHDEGAVILNQGTFNPNGMFIGNTGGSTVIEVGEVDFGTGDTYKAVSLRYANGWGDGGTAILSAGEDPETATPFAAFGLIRWRDSYQNFRSIGGNFTDQPTGVQKVYLSFADRAGNILDVRFYNDEFTAEDFDSGTMLKEPNQYDSYAEVSTVLPIEGATLVSSPSDETRVDGESWGWTQEGVVVNYGEVDFGEDGFDQVILGTASHWNGDVVADFVEVYIDNVDDEANLLASVWTGIEIRNGKIYLARNIEKKVTGTHTIFLKWRGGSTNIAEVEFCKGYLWSIGNRLDIDAVKLVNEEPSENAVRYTFLDNMKNSDEATYVGRDSGLTEILNRGTWEGDNVGYTGDGTVLKISQVDFEDGRFDKILVTHSTGNSGAVYVENSNFKFYIDLEDDATAVAGAPRRIAVADWGQVRDQLTDIEPIATVKLQRTNGWSNIYTTIGDLSKVEGVHTLYVVYTCGDGANVNDFYLDDQEEEIDPATGVATVTAVKVVNNNVYTIDGRLVRKNASTLEGLAGGLYIFNGQKILVK